MAEDDRDLAEIEADIRAARAERFWTAAGKIAVIISILVVLGTIWYVTQRHIVREGAVEETAMLMQGVDRLNVQDYRGAIAVFDAIDEDTDGLYYSLALLYKAQAQQALSEDALPTFEALAQQDTALAPLGILLQNEAELETPNADSAFYFAEQERFAWQRYAQGEVTEAVLLLNGIMADPKAPADQRNRIKTLMAHLAPNGLAQ